MNVQLWENIRLLSPELLAHLGRITGSNQSTTAQVNIGQAVTAPTDGRLHQPIHHWSYDILAHLWLGTSSRCQHLQ